MPMKRICGYTPAFLMYIEALDWEKILMPLKKSASKAAFKSNIKAEVKAGKPDKQAVAIAFSEQRAAKKKKKKSCLSG